MYTCIHNIGRDEAILGCIAMVSEFSPLLLAECNACIYALSNDCLLGLSTRFFWPRTFSVRCDCRDLAAVSETIVVLKLIEQLSAATSVLCYSSAHSILY